MGDTLLPHPQLHVCLTFFEKIIFRPCCRCLVFFVLSDIDICYFMQESIEPVVLEENQSEFVGNPTLPARQVHVCFAFFEKIIFRPCCICLVLFVLFDIDICYIMKESIDPVVLEEHQSEVVVDPPLTSKHVGLCIAFFVHLCIAFFDLVLSLCMFFFL